MKHLITLFIVAITISVSAKTSEVAPFHTIVTGPHIEVVLQPGEQESVDIESYDVDEDDVIIEVNGNTLHVYLKDAKNIEKRNKYKGDGYKYSRGIYQDARVTATITYTNIQKLVTKGEQKVTVNGILHCPKFKYKSYGEQKVVFEGVETNNFRAKLYGSTNLEIKEGYANLQRYKLYGEHDIDTRNVKSSVVKTANYGEVDMNVDSDLVALTSFGEADINTTAKTRIRKGIVIGETRIR